MNNAVEINYEKIPVNAARSYILFKGDNCLYKKSKGSTQNKPTYYICIENGCKGSGKITVNNPETFVPYRAHSHQDNHEVRAGFLRKNEQMAKECGSTFRNRYQIYLDHLAL